MALCGLRVIVCVFVIFKPWESVGRAKDLLWSLSNVKHLLGAWLLDIGNSRVKRKNDCLGVIQIIGEKGKSQKDFPIAFNQ